MGRTASCLVGLSCFLQVATATAIIVITALKLHRVNVTFNQGSFNTDVANVCLLGTTDNGANLCYFAYIVGGISIIATGVLSILQCCTCHLCGLGTILDALFAAAGTVLWAVAGVIFNYYGKLPGMSLVPRPEWRAAIPILAFVACGLFGLMCLAAIWSMIATCCGCCGGKSYKSRGRKDVEAAAAPLHAPAKRPAAAGQQFSYPQPAPYYPPPAGYPAQGQFLVVDNSPPHYRPQASRF